MINSNNNNNNINNNILNVYTSSKKKPEVKSKEIKLDIKDESDLSIKETNIRQKKLIPKDSSILVLKKEDSKEESKVDIDENNFQEKNTNIKNNKDNFQLKNKEERQSTIGIKDENEDMEYYIFILDNNGNMNMYKNKKNRTIFNLYNVKGIDESYKEKKFFSVGYPYYFVLNELYFSITTDYGLFVIENKNKDF